MRGRVQQVGGELVITLFATAVYLLTMDRSASWWDCGEFIATSWTLGVGHPPGAPFYQLVAHCVMLLSFGNPMLVAPLSNALSAICGGITVGVLYGTISMLNEELRIKNEELGREPSASANFQFSIFNFQIPPAIGALCYLFCDTAWFSAVESEVYSMAMLFCALDVYLMLRWRRTGNACLLPLVALLLGLGVCVHLMTLLVAPALLLLLIARLRGTKAPAVLRSLLFASVFFVVGLTPYLIVPIRAAANPPINEGNPATVESFRKYLQRGQYEKAPLYPRMWRERDTANYREWTLGTKGVVGNVVYYFGYQLTYMYGRYLMYNFIGRENLKWHCVVPFVLPMLLGIYGLWRHRRRNRFGYWVVMLLFLFGGIILNFYLNHPCYEPRERDYAYVLSFYAFAVWIGIGAAEIKRMKNEELRMKNMLTRMACVRRFFILHSSFFIFLAPLLLAVGNWSDHDRHNCHSVHDISLAHLQSCDPDAILITLGDNDTFPLWYLQQVEGRRRDIDIYNINLTGFQRTMDIIAGAGERPVYVSLYFMQHYGNYFPNSLRCEGYCWRLLRRAGEGSVLDREPLQRHLRDSIRFSITPREYVPRVSQRFLDAQKEYWNVTKY